MNPDRPFTIVTGVLREALRASGRRRIMLAGCGPELHLLERWLSDARLPFATPSRAALGQAAGLLRACLRRARTGTAGFSDGPKAQDPTEESESLPGEAECLAAEASALAAWATSWAGEDLLVGSENKTYLLLSPSSPTPSVFPLGDLYASEVAALAGGATLPGHLQGLSAEEVRAVDRALEDYYEKGRREDFAFRELGSPLRTNVLDSLERARKAWRPRPLIPKLGSATLGLDLDP